MRSGNHSRPQSNYKPFKRLNLKSVAKIQKNWNVYDKITIVKKYVFNSVELKKFCDKHNLKEYADGKFKSTSSQYLKQGKGVYINVKRLNDNCSIKIIVSLHKLYNELTNGKRQNWNNFNFEQAKQAAKYLQSFIGIDLNEAQIIDFEIGVNVETKKEPLLYFEQLDFMMIKNNQLKILQDVHYKEFAQYSTNRSKDKRIVYIFYNKTHEATSKETSKEKRQTIPKNIIRIEMKVKRPKKKILFKSIFNDVHNIELLGIFKDRFINSLKYKTHQAKPQRLNNNQFEMWKYIKLNGIEKAFKRNLNEYERGIINKNQFKYKNQLVKELSKVYDVVEEMEAEAKELKALIKQKIDEVENLPFFHP